MKGSPPNQTQDPNQSKKLKIKTKTDQLQRGNNPVI